jgi:tight adherence protein C
MSTTLLSTSLIFATFLGPAALISVVVFVAVTGAAWLVLGRVSGDDKPNAEARLDMLRRGGRPEGAVDIDGTDKAKAKKDALAAALEKATSPLEKTVSGNAEEMGKLREKLVNAGFRRESAPVIFKGFELILAGACMFLGGVFGLIADGISLGLLLKVAFGFVIGFGVPRVVLGLMASKRKEKVFLGLPDALDLMVVCVEAGLGMDQALRKVAEEMMKSHREIGEEFGIANQQLQFGRPRGEVLQALGFRSGVDDLKQLASILIQADKFGSSVAQALRVQSDSMRTKRRQIAEEKAAKTAVKMIFPLVIFIFPGIFVVLVGPAAISMYRKVLTAP